MAKFGESEKFQAVLVSAAILVVFMGLWTREPQPDVHFTLDKVTAQKQCVKVVRTTRDGTRVSYPCSSIDLQNDSYNPVHVMGEDEVAEMKTAAR